MNLQIITAERQLYSGEVDEIVAPGSEGELGILPHHASLLTLLKPGELRVRIGSDEELFVVAGGFMEVLGNEVTVLADAAERADEIDEQRAQAAITRAQERIAAREETLDLERALHALRRAQIRVQISSRFRFARSHKQTSPGS